MDEQQSDNRWHLDKRVPVSIILTLLLQGAAGLWFAAKMDSRVTTLEESRAEQRARDQRQDTDMRDQAALIRSELLYIRAQLDTLIRDQNRSGNGTGTVK